jgi:hypothetical protein
MSLNDLMKADALAVFCNTSDFAETATYHATGGGSRSISVVIIRMSSLREDGGGVLDVFEVHAANDSVFGIASDSINLGGDYLTFPSRDGKTASDHTITRILSQDQGMLVLECL